MSRSFVLTNEEVSAGLDELARLLAMDARALGRSARVGRAAGLVRACVKPLVKLVEERGVDGVQLLGIDAELAGVITDWVRTGKLVWLERLKAKRRAEFTELPSIGPRLAEELRTVLGVEDLDGLAEAVREGRLESVCGFGPRRIKLIEGLLRERGALTRRAQTSPRSARPAPSSQPMQGELFG
jgi:DNA polymerase (family 10)